MSRFRKNTSVVVDSRLFERSSIAEEEKISRRLAKEKSKQYKKRASFNLPDDDDEEGFTHKGQVIDQIERYDDPRDQSGSEDELLDKDFVGEAHFGGFLKMKQKEGAEAVDADSKEKSRKEIIEELILSNKAKKLEKSKHGDEYLQKVDTLNSLFKEENIFSLLQTTRTKKEEVERILSAPKPAPEPIKTDTPQDTAFDRIVRELKFQPKPARETTDLSASLSSASRILGIEAYAKLQLNVPPQIPATYEEYLECLPLNESKAYDHERFVPFHVVLIGRHTVSHRIHLYKLCDYLLQLNIDSAMPNGNSCNRNCYVDGISEIFHLILEVIPDKSKLVEALVSKITESRTAIEDNTSKMFMDSDVTLIWLCVRLVNNSQKHPRMFTPLITFVGDILSNFKVKDSDMAYRLILICSAGYMVVEEKKRFAPEFLTCIHSVLSWIDEPKKLTAQDKYLSTPLSVDDGPLELHKLIPPIVSLTQQFLKLYSSYPAAVHLFEPIRDILNILKVKESFIAGLPVDFKTENFQTWVDDFTVAINNFSVKQEAPRTKAALPKILRLYEPQFDETFTGRKHSGPRAKQDQARLTHKIKQEKKGAIRDLKKDSVWLARATQKEQSQLDASRKRKVNQIMGSLSNQEGDFKKMRRGKK